MPLKLFGLGSVVFRIVSIQIIGRLVQGGEDQGHEDSKTKDMQRSIDSARWIRQIVRIISGDPPMTIARAHLVDPAVTRWYHCVTRCVRRAFLLGEGMHDRKGWIENRLQELA